MAESQTEIETRVETDNERIEISGHDMEGYVDDGEYATIYHITRFNELTIKVETYRSDGEQKERADHDFRGVANVDPDETTEEWAKRYINGFPEIAVKRARDHFSDD